MTDYLPPPSTLPPGSIAWAYLRDSGGPSQERSVGQQKAEIEAYCQRHGLSLTLVFADVARSGGSTTGRDQFNEMVDMSKHESTRPAGLLIWNYARFARDLDDSQFYKSTLRKRGLTIHSLTDPIPEGAYGQVVEVIIDIANQEKKRQTSRDAQRGLHQLVQQFGCVPGTPPTGFIRQPVEIGTRRDGSTRIAARWVPDPTMAPRVQQAFALRAAGTSLAEINSQLRLFGSINSYRTFWSNKLYIGILEYADMVIENYCEPLIDLETWETVQKISEHHASHANMNSDSADHPRRVASEHLLSKLLRCARCGSPLWAHVTQKPTAQHVYSYRCTQKARRHDCDLPQLPAWSLEHGVIDKLVEVLRDDVYYLQAYRALQRRQNERVAEMDQRRKDLQKDLVTLHRQMDNLTGAIAERGHSRALLDRLDAFEVQESELKTALTEVKAGLAHPLRNYTDEHLRAYANRMADLLVTGDQKTKYAIINSLVQEIRMDRQGDQLIGSITIYLDADASDETPNSPDNSPPGDWPLQDGNIKYNKREGMRKSRPPLGAQ